MSGTTKHRPSFPAASSLKWFSIFRSRKCINYIEHCCVCCVTCSLIASTLSADRTLTKVNAHGWKIEAQCIINHINEYFELRFDFWLIPDYSSTRDIERKGIWRLILSDVVQFLSQCTHQQWKKRGKWQETTISRRSGGVEGGKCHFHSWFQT